MSPEEVCAVAGVTLEYHRESSLVCMRVDGFAGEIVFSPSGWRALVRAWLRFDGAMPSELRDLRSFKARPDAW